MKPPVATHIYLLGVVMMGGTEFARRQNVISGDGALSS